MRHKSMSQDSSRNKRICFVTFCLIFACCLVSAQREVPLKKIAMKYGTMEVPLRFVLFDSTKASYWKHNDSLLKTQLVSQLRRMPSASLLVDTLNVYNHIFAYQSPQDLPMDQQEEKALDEVFRSASTRLPPDLIVDYQGCKLYRLQNKYFYYQTRVHVKSKSTGLEKYTTTYLISDGVKTIVFTFQSPGTDSYDIFKTFEFK